MRVPTVGGEAPLSGAAARLTRTLELILPAYGTPGGLLLEHPRVAEVYPAYLAAGAYVAISMVPLMEAALERARSLAPEDPVAAGLVPYLEEHIPEEMHGDEPGADLLADLEALGVDTQALRAGPLPPQAATAIGTQLFRIRHMHPVSILGFCCTELRPPRAAYVEELIERTGLPRDGFRQLLLHADLDGVHGPELLAVIDALPLESWHEQLIATSALETMAFLTDVWLDVVAADPVPAQA